MSVIPRSIASWMVRMDCVSSVPPHIHPPIVHVPRAIREAVICVLGMPMTSILTLDLAV